MKVFAQQIKLPTCNILFAFLSGENGSFLLSDFVDFLLSVLMFLHSFIYADSLGLGGLPGGNSLRTRRASLCSPAADVLAQKIDKKEIAHQLSLPCVPQRERTKAGCSATGT